MSLDTPATPPKKTSSTASAQPRRTTPCFLPRQFGISGVAKPRALVQTADGHGYTLQIGTRLRGGGTVCHIHTDRVVVETRYRDANDRVIPVLHDMRLAARHED